VQLTFVAGSPSPSLTSCFLVFAAHGEIIETQQKNESAHWWRWIESESDTNHSH
jgi:hypothetical protein